MSCFNPVCSWRGERLLRLLATWRLPVVGRWLFGRHLYTLRKQANISGHPCHWLLGASDQQILHSDVDILYTSSQDYIYFPSGSKAQYRSEHCLMERYHAFAFFQNVLLDILQPSVEFTLCTAVRYRSFGLVCLSRSLPPGFAPLGACSLGLHFD